MINERILSSKWSSNTKANKKKSFDSFKKIESSSKISTLTSDNFDNEFFFFSFDEISFFSSFDEPFSKKRIKKSVKKKKRVLKSIIPKAKQKVARKKELEKKMSKNGNRLLNIWRCDFDSCSNVIEYCWQSYDEIDPHYNLNNYWIEKWNKDIVNQKSIFESFDNELKERLMNIKKNLKMWSKKKKKELKMSQKTYQKRL